MESSRTAGEQAPSSGKTIEEIVTWLLGLERARERVVSGSADAREVAVMQARQGIYEGIAEDIRSKWGASAAPVEPEALRAIRAALSFLERSKSCLRDVVRQRPADFADLVAAETVLRAAVDFSEPGRGRLPPPDGEDGPGPLPDPEVVAEWYAILEPLNIEPAVRGDVVTKFVGTWRRAHRTETPLLAAVREVVKEARIFGIDRSPSYRPERPIGDDSNLGRLQGAIQKLMTLDLPEPDEKVQLPHGQQAETSRCAHVDGSERCRLPAGHLLTGWYDGHEFEQQYGAKVKEEQYPCHLCRRFVAPGGHACVAEDGSGRPDEHLAECACGTFHEPPCDPAPKQAVTRLGMAAVKDEEIATRLLAYLRNGLSLDDSAVYSIKVALRKARDDERAQLAATLRNKEANIRDLQAQLTSNAQLDDRASKCEDCEAAKPTICKACHQQGVSEAVDQYIDDANRIHCPGMPRHAPEPVLKRDPPEEMGTGMLSRHYAGYDSRQRERIEVADSPSPAKRKQAWKGTAEDGASVGYDCEDRAQVTFAADGTIEIVIQPRPASAPVMPLKPEAP